MSDTAFHEMFERFCTFSQRLTLWSGAKMMKTHPLLQHFWKEVQFTYIPKLHLMSLCTNDGLNLQNSPLVDQSIFFFDSLSSLEEMCKIGEGQRQPFADHSSTFGSESLGTQKVSEKLGYYCSLILRLSCIRPSFVTCNKTRR